jgi:hypothetical protein
VNAIDMRHAGCHGHVYVVGDVILCIAVFDDQMCAVLAVTAGCHFCMVHVRLNMCAFEACMDIVA